MSTGRNVTSEINQYPKLSQAMIRADARFPAFMAKNFARVLQHIELFWGSKEALEYLDSLIIKDRGDREGFPLEALREVAMIKHVHDFLFPALDTSPYDPFSLGSVAPPGRVPLPANADDDAFEFESATTSNAVVSKPALTHSTAMESPQEPVTNRRLDIRADWPEILTQHVLLESAELRNHGKNIYELQGRQIGEILVHYGLLDEKTLRVVRRMQERVEHQDQPIGQILVEIGIIGPEDLERALCIQSGIIMVDVLAISIPPEVIKTIPSDKAREKQAVPVGIQADTLLLAVADPFAYKERAFFKMLTGLKVEPVYAPLHEIVNRLNMYGFGKGLRSSKEEFHSLAQKTFDALQFTPVAEEAPLASDVSENDSTIINLVNQMILSAITEEVSDIHIELFQDSPETDIRFRRDGHMELFSTFPRTYHPAVVSRIKIMAGMDISERRRPQDGKISFTPPDSIRPIDLRVATIPTMRGTEFVTIRILTSGEPLPLAELGMADHGLKVFREIFHHTYGLILVCGPTGSGKTTTLHSVMKELNTSDRKIWTVEDPVEIVQSHLCQVQINSKIGVTFASVLRALLRADPDIIMIGEMRDQETAGIALEASMTGHLVLSTLHTNSASEAVARLIDLDIDAYNLSDALLAILAQRLARKLCPICARREEASARDIEDLANEYYQSAHGKPPARAERETIIQGWRATFGSEGKLYLTHPVGCNMCSKGYKGRIGLYELLQATPSMRHLIRHQSAAVEYQLAGIAEGMKTLKQDGIEKVLCGITDMVQVRGACA